MATPKQVKTWIDQAEADLRAALLEVSAVDLPDRARADKEYAYGRRGVRHRAAFGESSE